MLYNDYRPTRFDQVVGQDQNLLTLAKQAENRNLSQAYIFSGHRGTGKTTIARILSRAANCLHPSSNGPCNECANCKAILNKNCVDIEELDGATNNGVDEIRELIAKTKYQPVALPKKVYIIDEVHNLSTSAFDALLKTLEEPPAYCIFILCTTELHKIPLTIVSRCEVYTFTSISSDLIIQRLKFVLQDLQMTSDEDSLKLVAKAANGALRDALGILEQLIVASDGVITLELTKKRLAITDEELLFQLINNVLSWDTVKALDSVNQILQKGNSKVFVNRLLEILTDIVVLSCSQEADIILNDEGYVNFLYKCIEKTNEEHIHWLIARFSDLRENIRNCIDPVMEVKLAIIKCSCRELIADDIYSLTLQIKEQKKEIEELKKQLTYLKENSDPTCNDTPKEKIGDGFEILPEGSVDPFTNVIEKQESSEEPEEKRGVIKTNSSTNDAIGKRPIEPSNIDALLGLFM